MKLPLISFPSTMFDFQGNTFIAEASDMMNRHLQRIYDDACDCGFTIVSAATGKEVVYVLTRVDIDKESEVLGWEFHPSFESERDVPECKGTQAYIIND